MTYASPTTQPADLARSRAGAARFIADAASLPLAFILAGQRYTGLPAAWQPVAQRRQVDARLTETVFTGQDPQSGLRLRVECWEYHDYPVVEWTAWFTNAGAAPAPILSDLLVLDGVFAGAAPVLWHCNGDFYNREGYTAQETPLASGASLRFAPTGGRPCDRAFPYFRVQFADGGGVSLAVGWPAQWAATFAAVAGGGMRVTAGQETLCVRLQPGETVRTPRLTVLSWAGDGTRAANLWRRWHRDHLLPRPHGQPLGPRLVGHGTDEGEEFTAATEANQVAFLAKWAAHGIPVDVWWIDAGWYPCRDERGARRWPLTGSWFPDPERFPRGLKPVADAAARQGADLLVWFEPERVMPGTWLQQHHPEWLLPFPRDTANPNWAPVAPSSLLNLGEPACRQWLTEQVSGLLRDNGIRIYRQDFNFEPLPYWRHGEPPDRAGLRENLHVQGYLQYWDDLLARHPGLWIDSCASGGRRNDLETMRRAVPLHYTDFGYGDHPVKLSFLQVMSEWLPYYKEVTLAWDQEGAARFDRRVDAFGCHCGLGPMLIACLDIRREDYDWALLRRMLALWRRAAALMIEGDYYPLTPIHRSPARWVARQFHCPETGRGFVQGIRLPQCPDETLLVHPQGLAGDAVYRFENPETGEQRELAGAAVTRDGFTFALPARTAAVWFYQRQA